MNFSPVGTVLLLHPDRIVAGLQKVQGNVAEIVILLNRLDPDWLIHRSGRRTVQRLFCAPVINLFPRTTTRIEVTHSVTEQHLVVDRTASALDYEVFSVEVEGTEAETTRKMIFVRCIAPVIMTRQPRALFFTAS